MMLNWLCRILGHRWEREPDTKVEGHEGWWFEWSKCTRCGALSRQLVAGQEG